MRTKITFGRLEKVLGRLGYIADPPGSNRVVFRHPDTSLPIIMRRMRRNEILTPVDLLDAQNALANGGIVPKNEFDSLFEPTPLDLWHAIIDAEAEYESEHGQPPRVLKLPVLQAYDLAKLRRDVLGELSGRVMQEGIKVFEKEGLLGVPVKLVPGGDEFEFE
jgi:hypothetical protein